MDKQWVIKTIIAVCSCFFTFVVIADTPDQASNALRIEKRFMQQPSYILDSDKPKPVMQDSELHPDFIKVLEPYPEALEAANESLSYSGVTLAGTVILTIGAAMGLLDTLDDKNNLDNNRAPTNDNNQEKALGVVIVGAIISLVGTMKANKSMDRALHIFNSEYNKRVNNSLSNRLSYANKIQQEPYFSFVVENTSRILKVRQNQSGLVLLTSFNYRF